MTLLYEANKELCDFASTIVFGNPGLFEDKAKAIGVILEGLLLGAVVYSHFGVRPDSSVFTCEMSIGMIDKRWATRHNLKAFFSYPFIQLGLERVTTLCSAENEGVQMFNQRLGFIQEGYHKSAWPMGGDAISWRMLKSECKWVQNG